jgi:hypothetical protein
MDTDSGAAETKGRWCDLHRGHSPTAHLVAIDLRPSGPGLRDRYACDDCRARHDLPSLDGLTTAQLWTWARTGIVQCQEAAHVA